jgi:PAS domain S-box-containing protein
MITVDPSLRFPELPDEKESFFSKIVELAADSILAINEDLKLVFFNQEAEKTFGYKSEEIIGQHINKLIPTEYHETHNKHIKEFLSKNIVSRLMNMRSNIEVKGQRKDGSIFFCEVSIIKVGMRTGVFLVAILRDITKSKEAEKKLRNLAEIDALTGIMNRGTIENILRREIERASRYDKNLALLMLDIDHFKKVNDTFGHDIGDIVLKNLTLICLDNIREVRRVCCSDARN